MLHTNGMSTTVRHKIKTVKSIKEFDAEVKQIELTSRSKRDAEDRFERLVQRTSKTVVRALIRRG